MFGKILLLILCLILLATTTPFADQNRKIFRVGYFEGGGYYYHKLMLIELKNYLDRRIDDRFELIYEPYGYKSAEWKRDKCRSMANDLARMDNIDMVIAAGPWVIGDLLEAGFKKPIIGIYQFDPEAAGLIDKNGRPVAPNLTVNWRPGKYEADMAALQRLFPAKNIGLLYFPSGDEMPKVRDKLYKVAGEYGAVVHTGEARSPSGVHSFFLSFREIENSINVLYLPPLWGMELDQMKQFLAGTQSKRIPIFTSEGFGTVEKGATASNCNLPFKQQAAFTADKMLKILDGVEPADLPTIFDDIPELCLNLEMANKLKKKFKRNNIFNARTIDALPGDTIPLYSLSSAISQAMTENAGILRRGELYQRAVAEAKLSYDSFYPRAGLDVSGSIAGNEAEVAVYNDRYNRPFSADLIIDQRLYSFSAIKTIEAADKRRRMEQISFGQAQTDLKHAITVAYLDVLREQERSKMLRQTSDRRREYWEMAVTNYRLGISDTTAIPVLEEHLVRAKIELFEAASRYRTAKVILNVLINRPGEEKLALDKIEFDTEHMVGLSRLFDGYSDDLARQKKLEQYLTILAVENSSSMNLTALSIGLNKNLLSRTKKSYLPDLSLRARYSYGEEFEPEISDRKATWTIGGMLSFPLFNRNNRFREGRVIEAEIEALLYEKDSLRYSHWREIMARASDFTTRTSTLPMRYFVKNISRDNLRVMAERFILGKLSANELISFDNRATESELKQISEQYEFFISYARLMYAVGISYPLSGTAEANQFYKELDEYMGEYMGE